MEYVLATRGSKLAQYQAGYVQSLLTAKFPEHQWKIQTIVTTGDRIQDRSLSTFGGKGVFLKEIEEALLNRTADFAVHSLKDVPGVETAGLRLNAFLTREDPRDVWASYQQEFAHLPAGKRVGTSSLRRTVTLKFYRPDLKVELLRGNLDTRLRKLKEGQYDAIIIAAAGLHRLNLFEDSFMHYLSEDSFVPAIGQAVLTIQTRESDHNLIELISQLNDPLSETAARIERNLLARYEGGCNLPIGALATLHGKLWRFRALIGGAHSNRIVQDVVEEEDPNRCAPKMFERLQDLGASKLLQELHD
jgi:hydroxymethylbilane synthase